MFFVELPCLLILSKPQVDLSGLCNGIANPWLEIGLLKAPQRLHVAYSPPLKSKGHRLVLLVGWSRAA